MLTKRSACNIEKVCFLLKLEISSEKNKPGLSPVIYLLYLDVINSVRRELLH